MRQHRQQPAPQKKTEQQIEEQKIRAQVEPLLLVPAYLVILAWIAKAFGWW